MFHPHADASIGFMHYHYSVNEDDDRVIVCAYVEYPPPPPRGGCDINFPFNISLATSDGSAGIDILH